MTARTRLVVLSISLPVVAFAVVGGFLGTALAREDTYQYLRTFDDALSLINSNYVEPVSLDRVMLGGMHGLADGLDAESAFLTREQVRQLEQGVRPGPADVGLELTRQYYLRVLAARDDSPAFKAGLRTGDFVRAINNVSTREMSVWEGSRALRGAPGTKVSLTIFRGNQAEPQAVALVREVASGPDVTARLASPGVGYVRVAHFGPKTAEQIRTHVQELTRLGATRAVLDIRRSSGDLEAGIGAARLFVKSGTLVIRVERGTDKQPITAASGDGGLTLPLVVLFDTGTSGPGELLAAALAGNQRADLVGERTIGRTAVQRLVKLPDGSGLWLSTARYVMPSGVPIHEKGLQPAVETDTVELDADQPTPTDDAALDKAIERVKEKP